MKQNLFYSFFICFFNLAFLSNATAQCHISVQPIGRLSNDELQITVQGNASRDCHQVKIHWTNPSLPDKIVAVNINHDDLNIDNTWSTVFGSADGLSSSMLQNNFNCNSNNFSLEVTCVDNPICQVTLPEGGMQVKCKQIIPSCSIQDVDLNCSSGNTRGLTASAFVSGTPNIPITVVLRVTRDESPVSNESFTESDGGISASTLLPFQEGEYTVTAEITSPEECRGTRAFTQIITNDSCHIADGGPANGGGTPPPCSTCQLCGGDWACCIAWILVLISLFVLVASILYLICDPSGAGGWGWVVFAVSLIALVLSIWWITENCDFNICRLLQMITAAITLDVSLVCAVQGLIPCFSALICGSTVIAGRAVSNWFIIMIIGLLVILGIGVVCPG